MKTVLKNKLAMYRAVQSVLQANEASWNGIPAFLESVSLYNQRLQTFESIAHLQSFVLEGVSEGKEALHNELSSRVHVLAGALTALASSTNNFKLLKQVKISKSDLRYAATNTSLANCRKIIDHAMSHQSELGDYGITPEIISIAHALYEEMNVQTGAPRQAIIDRKMYTASLEIISSEIDDILRLRIDRLILQFQESHPDFYARYQNARSIIDRGHSAAKSDLESPDVEPDDGIQ